MTCHKGYRYAKDSIFSLVVHIFSFVGVLAACCIVIFLLIGAMPALKEIGLNFIIETQWYPSSGEYGIAAMLACSVLACFGAVAIALPIALLGAACTKNIFPGVIKKGMRQLSLLLCGLPSVIFGLLGLTVLMPFLLNRMPGKMAESGGASLFTTILVLSVMLLPGLFISCFDELELVGKRVDEASCALGATVVQTVFCAELPSVKKRMIKVGAAGVQRALCEAMAVLLVSGNVVRMPSLFKSARLLASGMVLEMGYASGVHRGALFCIGLVLLIFALFSESLFRWLDSRSRW